MHTALVLAALVTALDPAGPATTATPAVEPAAAAPASAAASLPADPCGKAALPAPEPACDGAALCAARDRVRTMCELREAVRSRYVFLDVKRTLLGGGFEAAARLDGCVEGERAIAREDEPLRFYDRVRTCLAGFQDGHLIVTAPVRLPQVALGVELRRAGGKVVVAAREPALGALDGDVVAAALPFGAQVVAIDGTPVADAVVALAREVPGSSQAARSARAVEALTRRDFAYPDRKTATLTVALASGEHRIVELPWWSSPGAERHPVAGSWARRAGLPTTTRFAWFEDALRPRKGAAVEGAPAWAPVVPAASARALTEYLDDTGRVAVRLGVVEQGVAQPFCYLQILSFHSVGLTGLDGRHAFAAPVTDFVRRCGAQRRDVVLDLRHNEGGYLDHSTAIAEALAPRGAPEPPSALLLRATERNEAVYRERAAGPDRDDDVLAPRHVLEAIRAARRGGQELTPGFVTGAAPRTEGFPGKVVALTSPACMSACDRLAALLKASGHAVLIGGPTEGAGGSQQEAPGLPARWTDSQGVVSVSIPNAAFGVRRAAAGVVVTTGDRPASPAPVPLRRAEEPRDRADGLEVPPPAFFESFGIENHPVVPDVRYETGLEDVTGGGKGWLRQIDAVLSGSPLA
jgi:C-terminal processing protease CtpA/Prc